MKLPPAEWWSVRPVRSMKPATYRCPLCGYRLHAMSDHVLIAPEGDTTQRRHAHAECVAQALKDGRLRSRDAWRKDRPGLLARLRGRA